MEHGRVLTYADAIRGSHVHEMLKCADQLTDAVARLLANASMRPVVQIVLSVTILFLRSQSFGSFLSEHFAHVKNPGIGSMAEALLVCKERSSGRRFVIPATWPNGKSQCLNTDLQSYTLGDVVRAVYNWLGDGAYDWLKQKEWNWQLSEDELLGLLHGEWPRGYVLMLPHLAATLRVLGRYSGDTSVKLGKVGTMTGLLKRMPFPEHSWRSLLAAYNKRLHSLRDIPGVPADAFRDLHAMTVDELKSLLCKVACTAKTFVQLPSVGWRSGEFEIQEAQSGIASGNLASAQDKEAVGRHDRHNAR